MMNRVLVLSMVCLAASPIALAQEPADLGSVSEELAGLDLWFGMYLQTKSLGSFHYEVDPEGDGLRIVCHGKLEFGEMKNSTDSVLVTGPDFEIRSFSSHEEEGTEVTDVTWTPTGDGKIAWKKVTYESSAPDKKKVEEQTFETKPGLITPEVIMIVVPLFDWSEGKALTLSSISDDGEMKDAVVSWVGTAEVAPRGTPVAVTQVKAVKEKAGKEETFLFSISGGAAVQIEMVGQPVRLVPGTAGEAATDLPATGGADDAAVRDAAVAFFRVVMTADEEHLDDVIDVAELHRRLSTDKPEIAAMSPEDYKEKLIEGFEQSASKESPDVIEQQLEGLRVAIGVEIEGDTAKIAFPGQEEPILFARKDGAWKLVYWAVFGQE